MVEKVEDAIIVAGGLGTRMLPATSAIPKEALPLVDTPALFHLCWEAIAAGCTRLHLIVSPAKKELANSLQEAENIERLMKSRPDLPEIAFCPLPKNIELFVAIQETARGLGDALSCALPNVKGPFVVLLGDNLIMKTHPSPNNLGIESASMASARLVKCWQEHGLPCGGMIQVAEEETCNYGILKMDGDRVVEIVEKPEVDIAPSRWALCGRYLWPGNAEELLKRFSLEEFGEMQTIEIQKNWMQNEGYLGVDLDDYSWYDSGNPLSWIIEQIDHSFKREDLSEPLTAWLKNRLPF